MAFFDQVIDLRDVGGLDPKVMKGQIEKCVDIRERFDEAMEVAMALNEEEEQLGWMKTNFQVIFPTLGSLAGCFLALGSGLWLVGTVSARR